MVRTSGTRSGPAPMSELASESLSPTDESLSPTIGVDAAERGRPMSCPVSSRHRLLILVEDALEAAVVGGVVGGVVLPATPDDGCPGAGKDADGVRVVAFSGAGLGVEVRGPRVAVSGIAGEVTERVAEFHVGSPAEGHRFDLSGLPGRGRDSGQAGQRACGGKSASGVADL